MTNSSRNWEEAWTDNEAFTAGRQKKFRLISDLIADNPPRNILDIGCGLAVETGMLQKKSGGKLYLLDGDASDSKGDRDINFGDADSMNFYLPIANLKAKWDERGLDYEFLDANNLQIPEGMEFDLVYSGKSCGFHYPLETYKEVFMKHSHKKTYFIFDIRKDADQGDIEYQVVDRLIKGEKDDTCLIKFLF